MSLRVKLVVALVLLSALATIAIGVSTYVTTADRLHNEVDSSLTSAVSGIVDRTQRDGHTPDLVGRRPGGPDGDEPSSFDQVSVQVLGPTGALVLIPNSGALPVDEQDVALAGGTDHSSWQWRDVTIGGESYRLVTAPLGSRAGAVQGARSLAESDRVLESLRNRTLLATLVVTLVAAAAGWLIARQITRRLVRLTGTAEHVAETGQLDVAVPVGGGDEVGRLAIAFNEMLDALAQSKQDQHRLVQDAGHELRTPLTSLRTNISVLQRYADLEPDTRAKVFDDLAGETRELTDLVNELVELATDRRSDEPEQAVILADAAERVAGRARRRTDNPIVVSADDSVVTGRPQAIERAMSNLVDNAAKFTDDPTAPIELVVSDGRVEVRDRGPGIAPGDLGHVFDRFYRAVGARSRPGSGLGLSIVRDVAESHGGTVFAEARAGGGAVVGFVLPTS